MDRHPLTPLVPTNQGVSRGKRRAPTTETTAQGNVAFGSVRLMSEFGALYGKK